MYKSPVDGRGLVEVAQEDGSTKYRDRNTGQMYDEDYAKENFEKFPEPGADRTAVATDSGSEDAKPKKSGRKGRAAKEDATKNPPTPKNNGQDDDDSAEQ